MNFKKSTKGEQRSKRKKNDKSLSATELLAIADDYKKELQQEKERINAAVELEIKQAKLISIQRNAETEYWQLLAQDFDNSYHRKKKHQ